ncbi:MAG: hypothetical protein U1C48_03990 [Methylotenera sp.]|nr:hypothetical protein [Methylotenera sp.]
MLRDILDKYSNATAIHATYAIPDELNGHQIARIARVQVASPIKTSNQASGEVISNWWLIHFIDLDPMQVAIWQPCNHAGALASYPKAIAAEPIPPPIPKHKPIASAIELLDTMREAGFTISVNGDDLLIDQARWIDDDLAALITQHKTGLIKTLVRINNEI